MCIDIVYLCVSKLLHLTVNHLPMASPRSTSGSCSNRHLPAQSSTIMHLPDIHYQFFSVLFLNFLCILFYSTYVFPSHVCFAGHGHTPRPHWCTSLIHQHLHSLITILPLPAQYSTTYTDHHLNCTFAHI